MLSPYELEEFQGKFVDEFLAAVRVDLFGHCKAAYPFGPDGSGYCLCFFVRNWSDGGHLGEGIRHAEEVLVAPFGLKWAQ